MTSNQLTMDSMKEKEYITHLKHLKKTGEINDLEFLKRFSEWKKKPKIADIQF
jgi:hypothetical protein